MNDFSLSAYDLLGVLGTLVYLASYTALQLGWMSGQGYPYTIANTVAAALVLISLGAAFNLPSALTQTAWIVIGVVGLGRRYLLSRRIRFTDEERGLLASKLPSMPRLLSRRLLDLGLWADGQPGKTVIHAGQPAPLLLYLATGEAEVSVDGTVISVLHEDTLIGEITILAGGPATATVTFSTPTRFFAIPAEALRRTMRRDPELRAHLEASFAEQLKDKLLEANVGRAARRGAGSD